MHDQLCAERGERIDEQAVFPHDELGDISSHIIRLYARLQRTTADRDREHALALHEQQEKIRIKKQLTNNINHELLHRITTMAAGTLDALPHNGTVLILLSLCGLTHRESYFDMVMTVIVTCLVALAAALILGSVFGSF